MDFIKMLREDNELSDLMCDVCDMEIGRASCRERVFITV